MNTFITPKKPKDEKRDADISPIVKTKLDVPNLTTKPILKKLKFNEFLREFEIIGKLGFGSNGIVLLIRRRRSINEKLALKVTFCFPEVITQINLWKLYSAGFYFFRKLHYYLIKNNRQGWIIPKKRCIELSKLRKEKKKLPEHLYHYKTKDGECFADFFVLKEFLRNPFDGDYCLREGFIDELLNDKTYCDGMKSKINNLIFLSAIFGRTKRDDFVKEFENHYLLRNFSGVAKVKEYFCLVPHQGNGNRKSVNEFLETFQVNCFIQKKYSETVASYVFDQKARSFEERVSISIKIALILEKIHSMKIYHKDLKLDNCFIKILRDKECIGNSKDIEVVIGDFGLASSIFEEHYDITSPINQKRFDEKRFFALIFSSLLFSSDLFTIFKLEKRMTKLILPLEKQMIYSDYVSFELKSEKNKEQRDYKEAVFELHHRFLDVEYINKEKTLTKKGQEFSLKNFIDFFRESKHLFLRNLMYSNSERSYFHSIMNYVDKKFEKKMEVQKQHYEKKMDDQKCYYEKRLDNLMMNIQRLERMINTRNQKETDKTLLKKRKRDEKDEGQNAKETKKLITNDDQQNKFHNNLKSQPL